MYSWNSSNHYELCDLIFIKITHDALEKCQIISISLKRQLQLQMFHYEIMAIRIVSQFCTHFSLNYHNPLN